MAYAYVDCPHCGREAKIEDNLVGQDISCPQCGESFLAEVGGSYDLEGSPSPVKPPRRAADDESTEPEVEEMEEDQPRKGWLEEWPKD